MQLINPKALKELRTKESIKNNKLTPFVQYKKQTVIARQSLRPLNALIYRDNYPFVQYTKQPMKAFKHILVDGEYCYVYEDHIHFLTKKRQRIAGKQVTGYAAKGVEMREVK
ncbi:hypothetical protein [Arsenophonus sp. PmNCSU2021_1]|uniref:hypothetical protein n=1 Tax=Arsenophonus sp. PmNCSU2021_1 TaxID=3118989 RepID=UPI002FF38DD0